MDNNEQTRRHEPTSEEQPRKSGTLDMAKLRRDLEESRRLHDEAVLRNRAREEHKEDAQPKEEARSLGSENYKTHKDDPRVAKSVSDSLNIANRVSPQTKEKAEKAKELLEDGSVAVVAALSSLKDSAVEKAKEIDTDELKEKVKGIHLPKGSGHDKKPHKPLKERRGCGCLLNILFVVLLVCLVFGVAFGALWAYRAHNAPTPITEIAQSEQVAVATEREKHNIYLLLAGTDQRADEISRSDTIIYMVLRPSDRKIEMVSLPRDSLVEIPGVGQDKINASLAYGNMPLLKETVENLLDSPVDHTVLINFESFAKIIDAMGGITIDVPEKMYLPEEGIDLEAGEQKLKGSDALAFVRWRGDGTGDIGRMERQSQFLQAVADKARHLMPWQVARVAWVVTHEIDTDLGLFDLMRFGWNFIGMDSGALERQAFELNPTYINGISYVLLDDYNIFEVVQTMKYGMVLPQNYGY